MKDMKKILLIAGGVFLVLALGAYLASVQKRSPEVVQQEPTPAPVGRPEPGGPKVDIGETQKVIEEGRETIQLSDVTGGGSRGTATRSFDGTNFLHTASAQLPSPGAGKFYEGWLVSTTEEPKVISAGRMGEVDTGRYALVYSASRALFAHEQVVITLEVRDDGRPETHILEGSF